MESWRLAGLVSIEEAVFEKEGRSINYRKVSLTPDAEDLDERVLSSLMVKDGFGATDTKVTPRKRAAAGRSGLKTDEAAEDAAELTGRAGRFGKNFAPGGWKRRRSSVSVPFIFSETRRCERWPLKSRARWRN